MYSAPGYLKGYVRRFAQKSHDHRGTREVRLEDGKTCLHNSPIVEPRSCGNFNPQGRLGQILWICKSDNR